MCGMVLAQQASIACLHLDQIIITLVGSDKRIHALLFWTGTFYLLTTQAIIFEMTNSKCECPNNCQYFFSSRTQQQLTKNNSHNKTSPAGLG